MTARWITADVFDGLATLETGSVDLVVTSPPFLALRSYLPADHPDKHKEIGSEATPAEFIDVLLRVTQELRRVLAPHGSIAIELGDTYAGSGGGGGDYLENGWREGQQQFAGSEASMRESNAAHWRQKNQDKNAWPLAKSRTLIPQIYEIALAYGINPLTGQPSPAGQWRIRNVVTWARPNPPVGALGDKWRPATSDLIVACVSPKRYWDDLATRKPVQWPDKTRTMGKVAGSSQDRQDANHEAEWVNKQDANNPSGAPLLDYWEIPLLEGEEPKRYGKEDKPRDPASYTGNGYTKGNPEGVPGNESMPGNPAGAPLLDYWEIPPGGYKGSHYAVFPEELVVPCVKAMCPEKVCRVCGEPSRRIVEKTEEYAAFRASRQPGRTDWQEARSAVRSGGKTFDHHDDNGARGELFQTAGWTSCGHGDYRPGLVLDPFAGSGTTLSVATGHGHDAIGVDLDPRNADLARDRIGPFLFEEVTLV